MFALFDNLGTFELILCGVAGLLVFGRRLPEVASQAGATLAKFKKSLDGAVQESGVQDELRKIQQAIPTDVSVRDVARAAAKKMEGRMRELGTPPPLETPHEVGDVTAGPDGSRSNATRGAQGAGAGPNDATRAHAGEDDAGSPHASGTVARGSYPLARSAPPVGAPQDDLELGVPNDRLGGSAAPSAPARSDDVTPTNAPRPGIDPASRFGASERAGE